MMNSAPLTPYTAAEVLAGWRRYSRRRWSECPIHLPFGITCNADGSHIRIGEPGGGVEWRLDVEFQMACRVERFYRCHIHLLAQKPQLMLGGTCMVFEDWYSMHPLPRVFRGDVEIGKRHWPELDAVKLSVAVQRWNDDNPGNRASLQLACRAAKRGELDAWRPQGVDWYSTAQMVGEWAVRQKKRGRPKLSEVLHRQEKMYEI